MASETSAPAPAPRRLHAASPIFVAAKSARSMVLPAIFLVIAARGQNLGWLDDVGLGAAARAAGLLLWGALVGLFIVAGASIPYLIFRYRLGDDELVVRDGILTRTERHIPYARIQNIDLVRNPFHRFFDVALVRVETSSGGKPEAVLRVLSMDAVAEMRSHVFADREVSGAHETTALDEADSPVAGAPLCGPLSALELAKLGLASNKGMVVLGAALGVLFQFQIRWWEFFDTSDLVDLERFEAAPGGWALRAVGAVVLVVLAIVALRLFSAGWYVVKLHGFALLRRGDDLRAEYGLVNRVTRSVPTPRIQAVLARQTPILRAFGRQSLKMQTIGGAMEGEMDLEGKAGGKSESQWLAPSVEPCAVPALVSRVYEGVDLDVVEWKTIPGRASKRVFRPLAALGLVVFSPLAAFATVWALIPAALYLAWAFLHSRLWVRSAAWAIEPWGVAWRSGWINPQLRLVRHGKIQTVGLEESPFDRRHAMGCVLVDVAGGEALGHTIRLPYLEIAEARRLVDTLFAESSARAFRL